MTSANSMQIAAFKAIYCQSKESRLLIKENFEVAVESFEELLPGCSIKSYATGNRNINNSFITFSVFQGSNIVYHPVFSETIGRELVRAWNLELPSKMTIFVNEGKNQGGHGRKVGDRNVLNKKLLRLIQFARTMMIMHIDEPKPMDGPFKAIYTNLEQNPNFDVKASNIKSINTAIKGFLHTELNRKYENFKNLQEFIQYLQVKHPERHLRNFDFAELREKMKEQYHMEDIVF